MKNKGIQIKKMCEEQKDITVKRKNTEDSNKKNTKNWKQ